VKLQKTNQFFFSEYPSDLLRKENFESDLEEKMEVNQKNGDLTIGGFISNLRSQQLYIVFQSY